MSDLGVEILVRVRPVLKGKHGEPGVGTPSRETFTGCQVYPRFSTEETGAQSTTIVGLTALVPSPSADINEDDQIEWRDKLYDIDGEPGPWRFMDGSDAALQVALKKVSN